MAEKESPPKILQEEIKSLEQILAEKKKELADAGKEAKHEETVKEAVKEYSAAREDDDAVAAPLDDATQKAALKLAEEPHAKQVEELLDIASKNGILNAVKVARHLDNPHLLDDFHDRLVLEFLKSEK